MNRLIGVVDIINTFLDTHYFDDIKFYNVCQLVDMGSGEIPALYKGNGDMEAVVFDDTNGLNVYHRLISQSDVEDDNEGFGRNNLKSELYTMRAVFFGADQADILDESIDINYNIADEFKTLFPNRLTKNQLTNIDGLSGIVKTISVNHNKQAVFNEEITNTSFTVTPESILFAIEYTISLQYLESCKTLICDPYPTTPMTDLSDISCENFLDDNFGLTQQQFDDCGLIVFAPSLAAAFSADDESPITGQTVTFTDASTGTPTAWLWEFGDGYGSTEQNPRHEYFLNGSYTVTLIVYKSGSISSTTTVGITVSTSPNYTTISKWFFAKRSLIRDSSNNAPYLNTVVAGKANGISFSGASSGIQNVTAASNPLYKANAINGYPAIDFSGNRWYAGPAGSSTDNLFGQINITHIYVIKVNSISGTDNVNLTLNPTLFANPSPGGQHQSTGFKDANKVYNCQFTGGVYQRVETTCPVGSYFVLTTIRRSTPFHSIQVNDDAAVTDTYTYVASTAVFRMGGNLSTPTVFFDGEVAEHIAINSLTLDADIQVYKDMLYARYGITP